MTWIRRFRFHPFGTALSIVLIAAAHQANAQRLDVRSSGGAVSGPTKVVGENVLVKVDQNLTLAFSEKRVSDSLPKDALAEYRTRLAACDPQDAAALYDLAIWCGQNRLREQRRYLMQRVVAIDPNHRKARTELGYRQHAGRWVKFSTLQRNFGLVNIGGNRWEVPEIIAREDAAQEYDKASKLWKRDLKRMIGAVNRGTDGAMAEIEAIRDPMASEAIAEQLQSSTRDSRQVRQLWVRLLGRLRTPLSVETLVQAGWSDADRRIREDALDQLKEYGIASARGYYTSILVDAANQKHPDATQARKAALALQAFPDPESAMTYVDALLTEHVEVVGQGSAMNFGFGNVGVNGMQAGGGPKPKVTVLTNLEVRNLLKQIEPGHDFGFDETKWKLYFASKRTHYDGDLRRDP